MSVDDGYRHGGGLNAALLEMPLIAPVSAYFVQQQQQQLLHQHRHGSGYGSYAHSGFASHHHGAPHSYPYNLSGIMRSATLASSASSLSLSASGDGGGGGGDSAGLDNVAGSSHAENTIVDTGGRPSAGGSGGGGSPTSDGRHQSRFCIHVPTIISSTTHHTQIPTYLLPL